MFEDSVEQLLREVAQPEIHSGRMLLRLRIFDGHLLVQTPKRFSFLPARTGQQVGEWLKQKDAISLVIDPQQTVQVIHTVRALLTALVDDDPQTLKNLLGSLSPGMALEVFEADATQHAGLTVREMKAELRRRLRHKGRVIVAIQQPGYHRALGYFQKLQAVDLFVSLDIAQYEPQEWQNRQQFGRTPSGSTRWLTVPVKHGPVAEPIATKQIAAAPQRGRRWSAHHVNVLEQLYRCSPYYWDHAAFLREFYRRDWRSLNALNDVLTQYVATQLGLGDVPTIRASHLQGWPEPLPKKAKLIRAVIERALDGVVDWTQTEVVYLSGLGARGYLGAPEAQGVREDEKLTRAGIRLEYVRDFRPVYRQYQAPAETFVDAMSILDLLVNHGPYASAIAATDDQAAVDELQRLEAAEQDAMSRLSIRRHVRLEEPLRFIVGCADEKQFGPQVGAAARTALLRVGRRLAVLSGAVSERSQARVDARAAWMKAPDRRRTSEELAAYAAAIRAWLFELWELRQGPLSGALSIVDLYTVFFLNLLDTEKYAGRNPRSIRIIPKGTSAFAWYPALAFAGLLDPARLRGKTVRELEPVIHRAIGADASILKMGTSLEQGIGMAIAGQYTGEDFPVVVFLSDGDMQTGLDHAAKFAARMGLTNLAVVIDVNDLQSVYCVEDVDATMVKDREGRYAKLVALWQAFGWDVIEIDGHDLSTIEATLSEIGQHARPLAIIARTVKGKGVPFMEGSLGYNHHIERPEEIEQARTALRQAAEAHQRGGISIELPARVHPKRPVRRAAPLRVPSWRVPADRTLEQVLREWLDLFVTLNDGRVFIINTDNASPFNVWLKPYAPEAPSPHLAARINERFALDLARGLANEAVILST